MTDQNVYALNTVSGIVAKVDAELLEHPTFGKNLIEVDNPDACIECGGQPDSVTTSEGDHIDLLAQSAEVADLSSTNESEEEPYGLFDASEPIEGDK